MRRYGLLLTVVLVALVGYSAQAATSAHKTVICHATQAGVARPYSHITTSNRAIIRAHRNRHPADIINPVGGLCPKQRLTWSRGGRAITAGLVPVPPNSSGAGSFAAQSNVGQGRICWRITETGLADVTAAHIHYRTGPKARQVAVPLAIPTPVVGPATGCVNAPRGLVRQILQHPGLFYVNVHTSAYPDGAISGMLKRATR
jgi:CHRD domain-containing protein